jgi:hypothetical protein
MIARLVIIVSFAANLALAALVVHAVQARHAAAPVVSRTVRTTTASATGVAPTQENVSAESDAPFRWAQLADADFKVYRDRLRAFGCPEQTVRDIIISEINEYFSGRCAALLADVQARFWEIAVHARDSEMDKAPWVVAMEALGKERDELVESVLGEDTTKKDKAREAGDTGGATLFVAAGGKAEEVDCA